jgi:hypothetical protein
MAEKTAEELAADAAAEAAAEAAKKKKKVTFDADQAVVVNSLYNRAFGEGASAKEVEFQKKLEEEKAAYEKKLADQKAELEAKLEEARKAATKQPEPPKAPVVDPKAAEVDIASHPVVKQLTAQFEEMKGVFKNVKEERDQLKAANEKARAERIRSRKKEKFLGALKDANVQFFDPFEAYELAEKEGFEYDDEKDRVWVKNASTGIAKLNENGEDMNEVDFVKEFATRKKYLVKSTETGGTGASSQQRLKEEAAPVKDYTKLSPEEFEAERQKVMMKPRS